MASAIEICNIALGQLGGERITSIENPETANEELCNLYYPIVRNRLLEEFDWSFLMKRVTLTVADASPPDWGYGNAFLIPSDAYRIIEVRNDTFEGKASSFKWRKEGKYITCDSSVIYLRYIATEAPSNEYTGMFVMAFAKQLAADMCMQVAENRTLRQDLIVEAQGLLMDAINSDNMQGTSEKIHANTLQNARLGGGIGDGGI